MPFGTTGRNELSVRLRGWNGAENGGVGSRALAPCGRCIKFDATVGGG